MRDDWMTCQDHVDFVRAFYPTWDADREKQLLEMLDIPMGHFVGLLSPGQRAQLQIVMALSCHPELLLIDEPGNLDAVIRQRLMETIIAAIAEQETTVVMASHIISELEGVCDHFCIIGDGRAMAAGRAEEVTSSYRRVRLRGATLRHPDWMIQRGVVSTEMHNGEARVVMADYSEEKADELSALLDATSYESDRVSLQELFVALTTGAEQELK